MKILWKKGLKPIFFLKLLAMKLESNKRRLACNQIKSKNNNVDKMAAKMAVYYNNKNKKIFPKTDKFQGFACKMLILLILELQTLLL